MISVVGSLNMDVFIETPRLPAPGETILGGPSRRSCGGKGANQAVAVALMQHPVTLIGAVGDDVFGSEMLTRLQDAGVNMASMQRKPGVPSGLAFIVVDAAGQNQIVVSSGANGALTPRDVESARDAIHSSAALLVQLEVPMGCVRAALELARAGGVRTIFNPAPAALLDEDLLRLCDFIIPNEGEASLLSGVQVVDLPSARAAAVAIRRRTGANVLITLGAQGVWVETGDAGSIHVPGFEVAARDTVGAGDTFIGAFAVRCAEGATVVEAARFACGAAAIAVTRRGAQAGMPTRPEVENWLEKKVAPPKFLSAAQTGGAG